MVVATPKVAILLMDVCTIDIVNTLLTFYTKKPGDVKNIC